MLDWLFVLLYLSVPVFVMWTVRMSGISLRRVSIPLVFVLGYLVTAYVAVLPLYFRWNVVWVDYYRATDQNLILKVSLYSGASLVLISLGFLFCYHILGLRQVPQMGAKSGLSRAGFLMVMLLVVVCVVVTLSYIRQIPGLPILAALEGNAAQSAFLRSEATNNFGGKYHRYRMFMDYLLPFLVFILYSHALTRRSRLIWLIFGMVSLGTLFETVMLTEKAPAVYLLIGLLFTHYLTKGIAVSWRSAFVVGLVALAIAFPMYIFFVGLHGRSITEMLGVILRRISGEAFPAYFYFKMFPTYVDYLMGASLPNPGGILPREPYRITLEVMNFAMPGVRERGLVGSMPTVYWGEVYANFGPVAPFLVAPVLGVVLYVLHVLVTRIAPSPIKAGLIAWLSLHYLQAAGSGLSSYLLDTYLYGVLCVTVIMLLEDGNGRIRIIKRRSDKPCLV